MEKGVSVNKTNQKIRNTVRHVCLRPNNEKWILKQYQAENPNASTPESVTKLPIPDYKRYAVRCLIEREEDLELAQSYLKSDELKAQIEQAINQTETEEKKLYDEVLEKEKIYQNIAPEFSIKILAQRELESTKER